jgi:hypothetical protein
MMSGLEGLRENASAMASPRAELDISRIRIGEESEEAEESDETEEEKLREN